MALLTDAYRTIAMFGFLDGSHLIAATALSKIFPSAGSKLKKLRASGFSHPFYIRPGTGDRPTLKQIFIGREYDCPSQGHSKAIRNFYDNAVSRLQTPSIIDCGAKIGLASLWYAGTFPQAKIIAVEPEPENFRILVANTANYPNILVLNAAISDRKTDVALSNIGNAPLTRQTNEVDPGEISTYTIPELMERFPNSKPMIVKIDLDGGEVDLFRSNVDWVAETPLIVFESHDWLFNWRGTFHAAASVLTKHRRDYIQVGKNTFSFSHSLLSPGLATIAKHDLSDRLTG